MRHIRRYLMIVLAVALFAPQVAQAQNAVLDQVFADVRAAYGRQERPMVIFDLEGKAQV